MLETFLCITGRDAMMQRAKVISMELKVAEFADDMLTSFSEIPNDLFQKCHRHSPSEIVFHIRYLQIKLPSTPTLFCLNYSLLLSTRLDDLAKWTFLSFT